MMKIIFVCTYAVTLPTVYCGLVDARISASEKDLSVQTTYALNKEIHQ